MEQMFDDVLEIRRSASKAIYGLRPQQKHGVVEEEEKEVFGWRR